MMQPATQNKIAQKALDIHAQKLESEFLTFEDTHSLFLDVFGNNIDSSDDLTKLKNQFVDGRLRPQVKFVSSEILTDNQGNLRDAAFETKSQTILLSKDLDAAGIESSIQQELGHWWDVQLNEAKDTTTADGKAFDEGTAYAERFAEGTNGDNVFSDVVYQKDSQTILVDGKATDIEFRPIGTWNIQGASASGTNTWEDVFTVMNNPGQDLDPIEVMAIQEAGNPGQALGIQPTNTNLVDGRVVRYDIERDGQDFNIYWTLGGMGSNEKNLAIVVRNTPGDSVEQIFWESNPTNQFNRRPILGVATGGKLYFSVHAVSGTGINNDAEEVLNKLLGGSDNINQYLQNNHIDPSSIFVLGDFNRNIASPNNPVAFPAAAIGTAYSNPRFQQALIPPDATTQNARENPTIRTLDYMFTEANLLSDDPQGTVLTNLVNMVDDQNRANLPSDHFPVVYDDEELPSLNDNKIQYEVFSPNLQTSLTGVQTTTVGEGVDLTNFTALNSNLVDFNVNFIGAENSADTNRISFRVDPAAGSGTFGSAEFNGYVFRDIGNNGDLPSIERVTVPNATNTLGIDAPNDVIFTDDTIRVNVEGLNYEAGEGFDLDIDYGSV